MANNENLVFMLKKTINNERNDEFKIYKIL